MAKRTCSVEGCELASRCRGWCNRHYLRWRRYGDPAASPDSAYDTFLALQAQQTDGCILWPYTRNHKGYGQVYVDGKMRRAHRLSCLMAYGPPPSPAHTDAAHSCRNRHCINPRHLRWATSKENHADRIKDGTDPRGERHGRSKLTEADVWQIRFFARGGVRQPVLARHFGVAPQTISLIVTRQRWTEI